MPAPKTHPMDPAELDRRATAIYDSTAWRAKLAREFDMDRRTIERWEQSGRVPGWLKWALRGLEADRA